MAATRLIPLHAQKGRTMHQCIKERTDYVSDDAKTEDGKYISSYECSPETVDLEFAATKNEYEKITGRISGAKDVVAYMIRQSFKPGEITPEEANQVGYETAMRWTKGKHAFIVATHTDKAHIHNHIIYNSTTIDAGHKYKNFLFSATALRRLSDTICLEHGLSVIEAKKPSEWQKRTTYPKRESFRDRLRADIDAVLNCRPADYENFKNLLMERGYEIKNGKYDAVKGAGQKAFLRFRSLGIGYTEEDIRKRIAGEDVEIATESDSHSSAKASVVADKKFDMLLDLQKIIAKDKGAGYERWAKTFNIKQLSKTLLYLSEQGIRNYEELDRRVDEVTAEFTDVQGRIKQVEERLTEIAELKKHIINFVKAKDIFAEYKKSGYSKKFFEEHREILMLRKSAKETFDKLGTPIPKIKDLNAEFKTLLGEKKSLYAKYKKLKPQKQELLTAKYNVDKSLRTENEPHKFSKKEKIEQER